LRDSQGGGGSSRHLILVADPQSESSLLLAKQLTQINLAEFVVAGIKSLNIEVSSQPLKIKICLPDGSDLAGFDSIYIKNWINDHLEELAASVHIYATKHHIRVCDSYPGVLRHGGKLLQMLILAINGFDIPHTLYEDGLGRETYAEVAAKLGAEFIVKDTFIGKGLCNFLIKNETEYHQLVTALSAASSRFLMQSFIPNSFDYRYLVIGDKVTSVCKRTRVTQADHRNNAALGAKVDYLPESEWQYSKQAVEASKLFGREIAGVDFIVSEEGVPFIIEVNPSPGIVETDCPENDRDTRALAEFLVSAKP
jgi:glutathione synthase/RimK-type ligase-like ATP-grasp enzyme